MGKTLKDRRDNDEEFYDFGDDAYETESEDGIPQLKLVKAKPEPKAAVKKRRPEMWDDDWTDPADDLFKDFNSD